MQRFTLHIHFHQLTLFLPLIYMAGEKVFFCFTESALQRALILQKWYSIQHTYYSKNRRKLKIFSSHIQSNSTQYTNTYGQKHLIFLLHILALYRHLHGDHSPQTSTGDDDRMQFFRVVLCCWASGECHDFLFMVTMYKPFYLDQGMLEQEGTMILQNVTNHCHNYTASHPQQCCHVKLKYHTT